MASIENRVAKLEVQLLKVRFDDLSDDELRAHAATFPFRSHKQYEALIALILRHGSTLPIVRDDPAHKTVSGDPDW